MASSFKWEPVINCNKIEELNEHVQTGAETGKLIVVKFTASWCPVSRYMAPFLVAVAKKTPHATFLKVDVGELQSAEKDWNVETLPTYVFVKNREEVDRVVGSKREELKQMTEKHA